MPTCASRKAAAVCSPKRFYKKTYRVTGTLSAAQNAGVTLNYDTGSGTLCTPNGHTSKSFPIINPILEADIIVNLPKLKTHTLAMMTAASKNLFGCVPGLQKVEMHARFSDQQIFLSALTDLACALCEQKEVINICDAVVGMEGNGPSGGNPVEIGYLIAGRNPFAVDLLCAEILGLENVPMVEQAISRGLCPQKADELIVRGEPLTRAGVPDVKMPDTSLGEFLTRLPKFLRPRPQIDPRKCVGCGKCAENCPPKIITIEPRKNGKGLAHIHRADCLRCFCCQEMCPFHAVRIHKNIIFRLVK